MPLVKQRILIVDDEATVRHTVRAYLEQEGFVVETAVNGQEALAAADPILTFQQLQLDPNAHRVWKNGAELDLTPIEYDLLYTLARHNGRVLSRDQLIEHVWGYHYFGDERVIDVHIRRIRRKVEDDPQNPTHIVTVRGAGYRFDGGQT